MRWKIIVVNSVVVVLVGMLVYALLRAQLTDQAQDISRVRPEALRVMANANAQLQLDALRIERWLDTQTDEPALREPFQAGTPSARNDAARAQCDRVQSQASQNPALAATPAAIVALVDPNGVSLGRNGSNLMRGEDLAKNHPNLKAIIAKGGTGSEIWFAPQQAQQWFVSYAAVRDSSDKIIGGIIYGTPLNDERLNRVTESGGQGGGRAAVLVAIPANNRLDIVAKSGNLPASVAEGLTQGAGAEGALKALATGQTADLSGGPSDRLLVAGALGGYGNGKQAVLIATTPASLFEIGWLGYSIFGASALGIVLVVIGGVLLGAYISRPIEELEEGLLQILNGRTDLRFELEHAELGGLVFRINTLLNQLMGVQEDDTDEEGRPSIAPSNQSIQSMDPEQPTVDAATAAALAAEPMETYYRRLFAEYIAAKRQIGDPVDHITEQSFVDRIRQQELDASARSGRPTRYQVRLQGKEVVLIAVALN